MTVSEMIGEDGTNEESFFEWLSSAQGDADDRGQQEHQVARALAAAGMSERANATIDQNT